MNTLAKFLNVQPGSCCALIGGGGKTTLMLSLADEATSRNEAVVITTTTKMWPPLHVPLTVRPSDVLRSPISLATGQAMALGRSIDSDGKVQGMLPTEVCELLRHNPRLIVVCEADGARGRPVKAHESYEPVIPRCSATVLIVAGLDAVGCPINEHVIHRLEPFLRITGAPLGSAMLPEYLALSLAAAYKRAATGARVVFVLNKADDDRRLRAAERTAACLHRECGRCEVLATSAGYLVQEWS